ncbi:hypothetical protein [Paraburkholderia caledonica]|uniref:Uncharacterized protein n=1 Tax=Paraburkholderia caledonica TaxID=134536 RepID=A0AB73IRN9_9BURK|nr:hypothetical protein [Paraburkholderia caledonica]
MELFFVKRVRAVALLLARRRLSMRNLANTTEPSVDERGELASLDRLVLDVRAGRVAAFDLPQDPTLKVIVTD